jgi:hypothetical protein
MLFALAYFGSIMFGDRFYICHIQRSTREELWGEFVIPSIYCSMGITVLVHPARLLFGSELQIVYIELPLFVIQPRFAFTGIS